MKSYELQHKLVYEYNIQRISSRSTDIIIYANTQADMNRGLYWKIEVSKKDESKFTTS